MKDHLLLVVPANNLNTNRAANCPRGGVPGDLVDQVRLEGIVLQSHLVLRLDSADRQDSSRAASEVVDSSVAPTWDNNNNLIESSTD